MKPEIFYLICKKLNLKWVDLIDSIDLMIYSNLYQNSKDVNTWIAYQNENSKLMRDKIHDMVAKQMTDINKATEETLLDAKDVAEDILGNEIKEDVDLNLINTKEITNMLLERYDNVISELPSRVFALEQMTDDLHKAIDLAYKTGIQNMTSVTYSNGRTVSFKSYIEMAVRTTVNNVAVDLVERASDGLDLVLFLCSYLSDSADDHAPYNGKIIVKENWQSIVPIEQHEEYQKLIDKERCVGYEFATHTGTYQKNGKSYKIGLCTRPNCRHTLTPITLKQAQNRVATINALGIKDTNGRYSQVKYEDLQKQRGLERSLRAKKLDLEREMVKSKQTLTPEEKTQNKAKILSLKKSVRGYQHKLKQLTDSKPYLTREYSRENPNRIKTNLGVGK